MDVNGDLQNHSKIELKGTVTELKCAVRPLT